MENLVAKYVTPDKPKMAGSLLTKSVQNQFDLNLNKVVYVHLRQAYESK